MAAENGGNWWPVWRYWSGPCEGSKLEVGAKYGDGSAKTDTKYSQPLNNAMVAAVENPHIIYSWLPISISMVSANLGLCRTIVSAIEINPCISGPTQFTLMLFRIICFMEVELQDIRKDYISQVWLFVTPWTVAHQAPLSMGFSRQEYWSGLPFPSPGDLPDPRMEPRSLALQADSLPAEPQGKPMKG